MEINPNGIINENSNNIKDHNRLTQNGGYANPQKVIKKSELEG